MGGRGNGAPESGSASVRRRGAERLRARWTEHRPADAPGLGGALEALYRSADLDVISPDPLELVLRYDNPADMEVAALLAASWAYGRADLILEHAGEALTRMGDSPARFVEEIAGGNHADLSCFEGLVHRFHRGGDWAALCWFLGDLRTRHGSLGEAFAGWWRESDGGLRESLSLLRRSFEEGDYAGKIVDAGLGLELGDHKHLLPDASRGSACKRLNLWLRWMVRSDHIDPGPWHDLAAGGPSPRDLLIPLDTHIARLGRNLGLTGLVSPGWSMAAEITASLAAFDADDPVKYDFALCRLGILDLCPSRRQQSICAGCPIEGWCTL